MEQKKFLALFEDALTFAASLYTGVCDYGVFVLESDSTVFSGFIVYTYWGLGLGVLQDGYLLKVKYSKTNTIMHLLWL